MLESILRISTTNLPTCSPITPISSLDSLATSIVKSPSLIAEIFWVIDAIGLTTRPMITLIIIVINTTAMAPTPKRIRPSFCISARIMLSAI